MTEVDGGTPFAALLRQYRAQAELTQEGLAEEAGLSPRSIQKLERGESLPYHVTVQRLARALRLSSAQRAELQSAATRAARPSAAALPAPLEPSASPFSSTRLQPGSLTSRPRASSLR
jgi:transcriptional regulator with XRE-family HTH domain